MPTKRDPDISAPRPLTLLPVIPWSDFERHNNTLLEYQRCCCYHCDPGQWCFECVMNYRAHREEIDAVNAELEAAAIHGKQKLSFGEIRVHHRKCLEIRARRAKLAGTLLLRSNGQPQWVGPYKVDGWIKSGQRRDLCPDHNAARLSGMPQNLAPSQGGYKQPGKLERMLAEAQQSLGKMPKVGTE